jgi:hypothetical protein
MPARAEWNINERTRLSRPLRRIRMPHPRPRRTRDADTRARRRGSLTRFPGQAAGRSDAVDLPGSIPSTDLHDRLGRGCLPPAGHCPSEALAPGGQRIPLAHWPLATWEHHQPVLSHRECRFFLCVCATLSIHHSVVILDRKRSASGRGSHTAPGLSGEERLRKPSYQE